MLIKKIFILLFKQPKNWKYLIYTEIGVYFLKKGAKFQVGQPMKFREKKGIKVRYIDNLYYNFKLNTVTHTFSLKPVPGFSDKYLSKKEIEKRG